MTLELRPGWALYPSNEYIEAAGLFSLQRFAILLESPQRVTQCLAHLEQYWVAEETAAAVMTDDVKLVLSALSECGALRQRRRNDQSSRRFDRQIRFLDQFSVGEADGEYYNSKLQSSCVCFIGLGGIGSFLSIHFVNIGIRKIIAFDYDSVEDSNLSRQILYRIGDIHSKKTTAAHRFLKEIASQTHIELVDRQVVSQGDLFPNIAEADLVINGFGHPPPDQMGGTVFAEILTACQRAGTRCLIFGGASIGPIVSGPGEYARMMNTPSGREFLDLNARTAGPRPEFGPAFSPRVGIIGSMVAWEVSRHLAGLNGHSLSEKIVFVDTLTYRHSEWRLV
jgi:hypothetical protein